MKSRRWSLEVVKSGVELFVATHSRLPTAQDFDHEDYLPSARQIQRSYGGMAGLREILGYGKLDFTKGELRRKISIQASIDGINAEEHLERILIAKFGEPYVHTQKRYATGTKSRYDFFIYACDMCFGIDVFRTGQSDYIAKNVRHKVEKYRNAPEVMTLFVAVGVPFSDEEIERAQKSIAELAQLPHMRIMSEQQLLTFIKRLEPLGMPEHFVGVA